MRTAGEAYPVDVCITGSNNGTSDNPKFALLAYFESLVIGEIEKLVAASGAETETQAAKDAEEDAAAAAAAAVPTAEELALQKLAH